MNRKKFYNELRPHFALTATNVSGFEFILSHAISVGTPIDYLAYMLATPWLETDATMQPIKEHGGPKYFTRMYDIKGARPHVARRLGNTETGDGAKYAGRGYVQLTGRANYTKASQKFGVDFVNDPDLVMKPEYALPILFTGMKEGWFTGKSLGDYIDGVDESDKEDLREFINARRIINGTDKARKIGQYALHFEHALRASGYGQEPAPIPKPKPSIPPVVMLPDPPDIEPFERPPGVHREWYHIDFKAIAASIGRLFRIRRK